MRVLDGLAKALGYMILLVVVLLLPAVSVARRAIRTVYEAPTLAEAVEIYWLNPPALAKMGHAYVREQVKETPSNEQALLFWRALDALNETQWETLVGYVAPQQALHPVTLEGADALEGWLQTPDASPEVEVRLIPWKHAVQANAAPLTMWLLGQFRECNVVETGQWGEATLLNNWALPPICVPLGAPRKTAEAVISSAVEEIIKKAPDHINFLDARWLPLQDIEAAKDGLLQARKVTTFALVVVVMLWLVGVALVSRSVGWLMQVGGATWLIGGILVAMTGFSARLLAARIMAVATPQVPAWARPNLYRVSITKHRRSNSD
jgi:hypothetical protein